jgi:hypothetical protein
MVAGAGKATQRGAKIPALWLPIEKNFKSRPRNHEGGRDAVWPHKMEKATRYHRMAFMVAGACNRRYLRLWRVSGYRYPR